jgi:hypothetical protein
MEMVRLMAEELKDPRTEDEKREDFEDAVNGFFAKMHVRRKLYELVEHDEDTVRHYIESIGYRNFIAMLLQAFGD